VRIVVSALVGATAATLFIYDAQKRMARSPGHSLAFLLSSRELARLSADERCPPGFREQAGVELDRRDAQRARARR
jgi:hypothetical protein